MQVEFSKQIEAWLAKTASKALIRALTHRFGLIFLCYLLFIKEKKVKY